ncbi:TonB-linked outer membrane protein, SusC/RagA family [Aquiflexum balticum DSM 16537]|uniref:TonB-linked outer membrane protein, SusC/RagA family n=1 Tax=Aquiflexum balticum DSM 16537 TaxID=758820 RepID=A0A1W2HB87_9BACT|nr:SusC/RagA family TonB-linked outer membrane protein [Aquiflexum balticum]SMD46139.1 TonB-linked outer membrane protein, SusC/RagA family [Aquiflexum balticum DSM 16537]
MKKKITVFVLFFLAVISMSPDIYAQDNAIKGKVTSRDDGQPLPGVTVLVQNTTIGTVTDIDGNYSINVPSGSNVLTFSFIGFVGQSVDINNRSTIDVVMVTDTRQLSEVVVTAFGIEQEKKTLGYAVQRIDNEDIVRTKQPNIVNALQGQAAGVQVTNAGGAPGQSARIIIRGVNSLSPGADNQPLFIVDGIQIDNSTVESPGTPRGLSNRVADLNPDDIESMSILKGAAATALYGVRAANGAVIITTKRGKAGTTAVNVSSSVGFETPNRIPRLQENFGQGFSGVYDPTSFWPAWGAPIAEVAQTVPGHKYQDNWRRAFDTGVQISNNVSISGGNDNATFFGSFGRFDHDGIMPFSNWARTSAKLNGQVKVSEKFNFSSSLNYINSGGNRVPHDRFMERLVYWAETQDVRDYINPDGTMKTYGSNTNPIYDARFSTFEDNVDRLIGNVTLNYKPADWIDFTYRIGADVFSDSRTEITPGPKRIDGEVPLSATGFIREIRINSRDLTSTFIVSMQKRWSEKWNTSLRFGNDIFERRFDRLSSLGQDFVIPEFFNLSNTRQIFSDQGKSIRRLVGFYGDVTVDYQGTVFLNVTGRNDISSTLPQQNNSFFYPSFNLSYLFSETFDLPSWMSFGKIRASYAEVGKDTDPHLLGATYVTPNIYPLAGQVGFTRFGGFGDPNLRPERTSSIELGTQLGFLDNRIELDIAYYKNNTKDQIIPVPVSPSTGFTSYITNAGEIQNEGVEFVIKALAMQRNEFRWNINFNLSFNDNTVKSIREGIEEIIVGSQFGYVGSTVTMKLVEGRPYGDIYGSSYTRFYQGGRPEGVETLDRNLPIVIGANGFPVRDGTQLILGNAIPKWFGGIRNDFNYKNWDFSFLVDGRFGVDQYNQFGNFLSAFGMNEFTNDRNDTRVFEGVLSDGSPNGQEVWLGQGVGPDGRNYGAGFYRNTYRTVSENFVQDASFIKLRNITLGYNFSPRLLEKTFIRSLRASVAANNIILYTPWDGFDPESFSAGAGGNAVGFTGLGFPAVQSLFFSLNLGF